MSEKIIRIMCLGDVVGRPGRKLIERECRNIRDRLKIDLIIANGENAAGGAGIDPSTAQELRASGVNVITLGDHSFQRKGSDQLLNSNSDWCIRPANYPPGAPGQGYCIVKVGDIQVGIANLIGRVFIGGALDCPFRAADKIVNEQLAGCKIKIVDMHAEATSEKIAMLRYLDGRVSLLFGTHTHVQTADETVSAKGTAYISDLGMCGCIDGVLGMSSEASLKRFLTGLPAPYELAEGREELSGIVVDIDANSGGSLRIQRLKEALAN